MHFPVGHGGLEVSPRYQKLVNERIGAAGGPTPFFVNPIGYGMCAPTVVVWGSEEQKRRYLRPLFTGEEIWCQLFSEPGAGSDFAGLAARGVRDGDEWVVNGQKVWTSLAHVSRWGLLVVRTDPEAVKHAGLTAFVVDMHAPGIDIRPLRQMTGDAEFNEVYFTDTRIPATAMLGAPGDGWRVSLTTLMNERVSIGGIIPPQGSGVIRQLVDVWNGLPPERRDPAHRDELMRLWCRAEVLRLTNIRASVARTMGDPGPEGSIAKAASASLNKDVLSFAVTLLGADGMLFESDYEMRRPRFSNDSAQSAARLPPEPRQLDRGRHHRGDVQHPRRATARPARRRARRPRHPLEPSPAQLTAAPSHRGPSVLAARRSTRTASLYGASLATGGLKAVRRSRGG